MVWARLDDNRHDEPDILALGDDIYALAAVGLLDHAITWASRHTKRGTDGYGLVPWAFWRTRSGKHCKKLTDRLLDVGKVALAPDDRGLFIVNMQQHGPRRDPDEAAAAGRKGGRRRAEEPSNSSSFSLNGARPIATEEPAPELADSLSNPRVRARTCPRNPVPVVSSCSLDGPLTQVDAGENETGDHQDPQNPTDAEWAEALTLAIHDVRPDWSIALIRSAIRRIRGRGAGWQRTSVALHAVASAPDSQAPHRAAADGWWWDENDTRYLAALETPAFDRLLERSTA